MLSEFYEFFGVNASSFLTMIENGGGIYVASTVLKALTILFF